MPTYKQRLTHLVRLMGDASTMIAGKRERITYPYKSEPQTQRNEGVYLCMTDRVNLLEVKQRIEEILEECKDDGYHC